MSAEPKQTIGDQLRAFAKLRRDAAGAPFQPHPVTRKILQDEVARTFSARTIAPKANPSSWLAAFWVRLAMAGGLVGLFVAAALFWFPKDSERQIDLSLNAEKVVPAEQPANTPQPPSSVAGDSRNGGGAASEQLAVTQRQNEPEVRQRYGLIPQAGREPNSLFRKSEPDTAPPSRPGENQLADADGSPKLASQQKGLGVPGGPVTSATPAASSLESKSSSKTVQAPLDSLPASVDNISKLEETRIVSALSVADKAGADQLRKAKEVALASALADRAAAPFSFGASTQATTVLFFSQTDPRTKYRRNFNSPPVPSILQSFQLQQSGANVRIIDADGSVYEGVAEQPDSAPVPQLGAVASSSQKRVANKLAEGRQGLVRRKLEPQGVQSPAPRTANSAGNLTFRVVGTNQTVNQRVVISGEFQPNNQPTVETLIRGPSNGNSSSQPVTLRAKASIGRNMEIPIEASGITR